MIFLPGKACQPAELKAKHNLKQVSIAPQKNVQIKNRFG